MNFKSIFVIAAFLFVAQYSLANPLPEEDEHAVEETHDEEAHEDETHDVEKCDDDKCRQLNTDNTFFKHWACSFTKKFLEWSKEFVEKCSEVLKELKIDENASKYEEEKKSLEEMVHLYEEAEKEEDKHKKFYLAHKMHRLIAKYMDHYQQPESKDDHVLELLKKHGVKDLVDEGHKSCEKYYHDFDEGFEKYMAELSDDQKTAHAKLVEWHNKVKATEDVPSKCKQFAHFFSHFDHELAKQYNEVHEEVKEEHHD